MEGRPRALARIPLGLRVPYPCRASRWGKLNADRTAGNCTIVDLGDGTSAIKCPDGSELVVQNGKDGKDGKDGADGNGVGCTLNDKGDGTYELACGDTTITIGDKCEDGFKSDLYVGNDTGHAGVPDLSLVLFEMTNCTWIRGDVTVENFLDGELPSSLLRIEKIDGHLTIQNNPELERVRLPLLREVGGWFEITRNDALTEIDGFPELVSAQAFVVGHNPQLVRIGDVPKLGEVERLDFYGNAELETIGSFDELSNITEVVYRDQNPKLADFPSLKTIGAVLQIAYNDELTSIDGLSALETVGVSISIQRNPKLPQCQVDAFVNGITVDEVYTYDNDEAATCP